MIGHTIPAAGAAGLIKTSLALHHKLLPPTLHADSANPLLEQTPFYLNSAARPWVSAGHAPRRAGVSAFGFGGINAHAVLEEYRGD
jgi:acyl transferase domain-containing protein